MTASLASRATRETHIRINPTGDPYGRGFCGVLQHGSDAQYGIYMGDVGAMPRAWWRSYAKRNGYVLVERQSP